LRQVKVWTSEREAACACPSNAYAFEFPTMRTFPEQHHLWREKYERPGSNLLR